MEKELGPLTFGSAIEAHRMCEDMSQKQFSLLLGISPSSLCDIEKGRTIPSIRRAAKIAKQIQHPRKLWVKLAIQDMLRNADLDYKVSVA